MDHALSFYYVPLEVTKYYHHTMKTYSFEKLDVWHEARQLSIRIYKLTRQFPEDE